MAPGGPASQVSLPLLECVILGGSYITWYGWPAGNCVKEFEA